MQKEEDKILNEEETAAPEVPEAEEAENTEAAAETEEKGLAEKLKESEERYLRLFAEFDNYKKRTAREKEALYSDAVIDTVGEFLGVADNLDRALAVSVESEEAQKIQQGVELVKKQMSEALAKLNVSEIKAVGEEFNPNLHNAVMHIEDDTVTENTVVEEFVKGYIYKKEKVVRYSMVKVAN